MKRPKSAPRTLALSIAMLAVAACSKGPLQDSDRELLVTAEDLAEYGVAIDREGSTTHERRIRYWDGTYELEYSFETADGSAEPLYLDTTASFERHTGEARSTFIVLRTSLKIGLSVGGVEAVEDPDFFPFGDDRYFAFLEYEGSRVGNVLVARVGKATYSLVLSGVFFDDAELWTELVQPKLEALGHYDPAADPSENEVSTDSSTKDLPVAQGASTESR